MRLPPSFDGLGAGAGLADLVGWGPRAVALGGAYAARHGDPAATWYNPAGLAPGPHEPGGALELSNVELSEEFINLITASTGFAANSRVLTTSDRLLQDLLAVLR